MAADTHFTKLGTQREQKQVTDKCDKDKKTTATGQLLVPRIVPPSLCIEVPMSNVGVGCLEGIDVLESSYWRPANSSVSSTAAVPSCVL